MTGKERVLGAINRTPIDRVPRHDAFWDETMEAYGKTGAELQKEFDLDIAVVALDNSMRFPSKYVDLGAQEEGWDRYGFHYKRNIGLSTLHYMDFATADPEDWEEHKHRFNVDKNGESRVDAAGYFLRKTPVPTWEEAVARINALPDDKFKVLNFYGPWEGTWRHHGFENTLMDFIAEPEMVQEMFEGIVNTTLESIDYALSLGMKIDGFWIVEDMGCTRSALFSLDHYREYLKPWHKKIMDFAHERGLKTIMHSCGDVLDFIPDLIDVGLDVLQALQANTRLDVSKLKEEFGDKITFMGNISVQSMAEGGDVIREEMERKIIPAMQGGGYIYHSDHSISPDVTYEKYCDVMKILDRIGKYN